MELVAEYSSQVCKHIQTNCMGCTVLHCSADNKAQNFNFNTEQREMEIIDFIF